MAWVDEVGGVIGVATSGVALAAALGLGALGKSAWDRITRSTDEQFLVDLAAHEQSLKRVDAIQQRAAREREKPFLGEGDPPVSQSLDRLANRLADDSLNRLHAAIARTQWKRSQARNRGVGAVVLGPAAIVMSFLMGLVMYQDQPGDAYSFVFWTVLGGLCLTTYGFLTLVIGRDLWLSRAFEASRSGMRMNACRPIKLIGWGDDREKSPSPSGVMDVDSSPASQPSQPGSLSWTTPSSESPSGRAQLWAGGAGAVAGAGLVSLVHLATRCSPPARRERPPGPPHGRVRRRR